MIPQSQTLMQQVSDLLQQYEAQRDYTAEGLTAQEKEFYEVLNFVYDLLSRTQIISSIQVPMPEEMKEPGFDQEFVQKYGISGGVLADSGFAFAIKQGKIDLREILSTLMRTKHISMKDVCEATAQGYPNMSRYLAGKNNIYADNLEKAINHCIKNE
jgi:hypothetical protein